MTTAKPARTSATAKSKAAAPARKAAAKPAQAEALLPNMTRDALGEVTETLEFMWSATQAVFGEKARPEHAISLLPYALDALEVRRLLAEDVAKQAKRKP
ncbi:hypothetical protein GCM10007320_48870 [Pseudorhodoferax aquiterrae]|uniref:Uncharacterized protein n=1 Tax=Pseudorhodoferax aquiterrae TaxID=747304 RepID=A0ABQ3G7Q1_9BURK|nr:hypothetical protein [Pseudorhodoferax aquiterrae]GHC95697.1 hypothetical protein GCM10007320_48870 [Pseudorhodoferax aquiterrae]